MFAVHGSGQQAKRPAAGREASPSGPEASLSWCLTQLSRAARAQADCGGEEDEEASRRAHAGLWRALVAIRTRHIKGGSAAIARYRARGGLGPLLQVLRAPGCHRKTQDLLLSTLANCCTERESREEVRKLGGIGLVVAVLNNVPVETVQNRAARALGNLAIDPENSALIHSAAPPSPRLECAQSAARTLLYLSDTPCHRLSLLSQGALPALALLTGPQYPSGLRRACLRALGELTRGCSTECAREVSRCGALAALGPQALDQSARPLGEMALKTLANLCTQACLRPLVGSLGVIHRFVEEVRRSPGKSGTFFRALCLCCKEAVNRAKVKESGGLEVLIGFLSANQSHPLSRMAVLAFVDFVYDELAMEQLQGLGLVPLLVSRLVALAKGEETAVGEVDTPLLSCPSELMDTSCFDSFDFPPPEGHRREEGKEQAQGSSSFLSLRSWLLSEGLISSEGELLSPSGGGDGNWRSLCASFSPPAPLSDGLSPLPCPSPSLAVPLQSSTPNLTLNPNPVLPSSYHKRSASTPIPLPPSAPKPVSSPPSQPSPSPKKQAQTRSGAPLPETPPFSQHPFHPEPWTSESPILLLLSRFSQCEDPSAALIHAGILPGLLYYLTQRQDPSARCFRMLVRLSCNPNCLQGLVKTGAAALIRLRLCLREGLRDRDGQTDRVKASTRQLGKTLLSNLRVQCESNFGSGVLSHIMLSGSDVDRLYCTLSLPLITGNKLLQKKLLLDSGALQSALEHIGCHDDSKDHTLGFWKSLASWLHPPQPTTPGCLHSLYFSLLTECLSCLIGQPKLEPDKQSTWLSSGTSMGMLPNNDNIPLISESHLPPPFKKPCLIDRCPYLDSDFDVIFLLDDGSQFAASEDAVAQGDGSVRVGSEYFRALLKGGFGEAQRRSGEGIPIRDVTAKMLLPVLHYLHGCCVSPRGGRLDKRTDEVGQCRKESGGHCVVLESLALGGLGKRSEGEMCSGEGEGFQNTPLAGAMAGASRFLVSGLQEELEALCTSLLQSLSAPRPVPEMRQASEDTERRPVSKAHCQLQANKTNCAGNSGLEPTCGRGNGKDLSSESGADFEVLVEPRKQAVGSGAQQGGSEQSGSELFSGKESDVGTRQKPKTQCILNLACQAQLSVGTAFKTSDLPLDSRIAWGSGTRLNSESANFLLNHASSGSPTKLNGPLDQEDEGVVVTASSGNSELQHETPSMESGTGLASNEDARPRMGSGESSHANPGTGSPTQPVSMRKNKLNSGSRSNSESVNVSGMKSDSQWLTDPVPDFKPHYGISQDSKPGSRRTSALDRETEKPSRATSKSCWMLDRRPGVKLGSALQKDGASDLETDSHSPDPTPEPDSTSSTRSDQVSGSQFQENLKASSLSDIKLAKPSGPKLDLSSRLESTPDTELCSPEAPSLAPSLLSDVDCEKQSLLVNLPELYHFSQLHNYPRLRQMSLSVLLWRQRTSPQLPPSLAADCMFKLARGSHCIKTLKQDLLLLVTGVLS
ncbi:armadillo repeat-containing protein 5 isoform X2 [Conger conger]|uniref:armadillo repeat-containing protein 5 isoform X2 n=1 Tax=Conger conger TaxID=82655 RepID=UPI002A598A06|nr:armadillo repeat-containing protein 5 isoform X2 [Conger conger]